MLELASANIFYLSLRQTIKDNFIFIDASKLSYRILRGTIFNWEHLLATDDFKNILLGSFQWFVKQKKCTINAFVLMPNHIHLLWKISDGFKRKNVEGALFSFTAHEFKRCLKKKQSDANGKASCKYVRQGISVLGENSDDYGMLDEEIFRLRRSTLDKN